ncbi:MAG: hypothetical protein ABIE23_00550 [archaeon]
MGVISRVTNSALITAGLYIGVIMLDSQGIYIFGEGFFSSLAVFNTFLFVLMFSLMSLYPLEKKGNKK